MIYNVPKSQFSGGDKGTGKGTFRKALQDKYIIFNYLCKLSSGEGEAQGIFVWDEKENLYRYWWFESSGNFAQATCQFLDDKTLYFNWHNSVLKQTFKKTATDQVVLHMEHPNTPNGYDLVLEVIFNRK